MTISQHLTTRERITILRATEDRSLPLEIEFYPLSVAFVTSQQPNRGLDDVAASRDQSASGLVGTRLRRPGAGSVTFGPTFSSTETPAGTWLVREDESVERIA